MLQKRSRMQYKRDNMKKTNGTGDAMTSTRISRPNP